MNTQSKADRAQRVIEIDKDWQAEKGQVAEVNTKGNSLEYKLFIPQ